MFLNLHLNEFKVNSFYLLYISINLILFLFYEMIDNFSQYIKIVNIAENIINHSQNNLLI